MNRQELFDFHNKVCAEALDIMRDKNTDYAKKDSPFLNLRAPEAIGLCDASTGMLVKCIDKLARMNNIFKTRHTAVAGEPWEQDAKDIINYMVLILAERKDRD